MAKLTYPTFVLNQKHKLIADYKGIDYFFAKIENMIEKSPFLGMDVKIPYKNRTLICKKQSVSDHRQSRWLECMNRSKRLILEPPQGGCCC